MIETISVCTIFLILTTVHNFALHRMLKEPDRPNSPSSTETTH